MRGKLIQAIGITLILYIVMEIDRTSSRLSISWTSSKLFEAQPIFVRYPVPQAEAQAMIHPLHRIDQAFNRSLSSNNSGIFDWN